MERGASRIAARLGVLVILAIAVVAPASSPARDAGAHAELRQRQAALADRRAGVLEQLTALETRLAAARAVVTALRSRALVLGAERRDALRSLRFAREDVATAQARLADRLRELYAAGDPDPLVLLLGAPSIADAMAVLDGLEATAEADSELVTDLRTAARRFRARSRTLAGRARELRRTEAAAAARVEELARARAERDAYLAEIRSEQRLTASALAVLARSATPISPRSEANSASPRARSRRSSGAPAGPRRRPRPCRSLNRRRPRRRSSPVGP